jgi:hypothetical protein
MSFSFLFYHRLGNKANMLLFQHRRTGTDREAEQKTVEREIQQTDQPDVQQTKRDKGEIDKHL